MGKGFVILTFVILEGVIPHVTFDGWDVVQSIEADQVLTIWGPSLDGYDTNPHSLALMARVNVSCLLL